MLKQELLAPAALDGQPDDDVAAARALARRAAACLRDAAAALGPGQLDRAALDDVATDDLKQYLALAPSEAGGAGGGDGGGSGGGTLAALRGRPARRLACIAAALGAVAASGPLGFAGVCGAVLDPWLDAVLGGSGDSGGGGDSDAPLPQLDFASATLGGGLAVLHAVLAALAAAPSAAARRGDLGAAHPLQARLPRVLRVLDAVQQQAPADGSLEARQARVWALRAWLQLLLLEARGGSGGDGGGGAALPQERIEAGLAGLAAAALEGDDDGSGGDSVELWLDWDEEASAASEAAAAITALSASGSSGGEGAAAAIEEPRLAAAVRTTAERALLPALRSPAAAPRALAALQLLAGGEHGGAWRLIGWLQPIIVELLAAHGGGGGGGGGGSGGSGDSSGGALLGACLRCMHEHAVAQLPLDLSEQQAAEAAGMVDALLAALEQAGGRDSGGDGGGGHSGGARRPLQLALLLVSRLAARCSAAAQGPLLLGAAEWATEAAAEVAAGQKLSRQADLKAAAAAALLIGLRPELLTGGSVADIAAALARVALAPGARAAAAPAAVALGALANKWRPEGDDAGAAAAEMAVALSRDVLVPAAAAAAAGGAGEPQQQQQSDAVAAALAPVAWMARGLAMARSDAWQQLAALTLDLVGGSGSGSSSSSGGDASSNRPSAASVTAAAAVAAAGVFETLVADAPPGGRDLSWCLDQRGARARGRPLWQQKAFVLALGDLSRRTSAAAAAVAAAAAEEAGGGGGGGISAGGNAAKQALHALSLCTAGLLSSAPRAVYRSAASDVAAQLVACASRVAAAEAPGATDAGGEATALDADRRLQACLLVISDLLTDAALLPLMEAHADALLPLLLALARHRGARGAAAAAARETALECLVAAMQLPYRLLHPHRRAALKTIAAALDDDKRAVRWAAVRARRVWSAS